MLQRMDKLTNALQASKTATFVRKRWVNALILCILGAGAWARTTAYGNFRLSIGMSDTPSYITSSRASLLSLQIFTSERLFTTNILYKLANDPVNCPLTVVGNPAVGIELPRGILPCFDKIVLLQNVLSMIGWSFLALVIARWLQNPLYKILAVIIVLTFGFTPQIAEWDSILSSESISLSVFSIVAGLTLEISQRIARDQNHRSSATTKLLTILWLVIFVLWVFLRDVHLYACLITIVMLLPLALMNKLQPRTGGLLVICILTGVFILGMYTTQKSPRWELPLFHVLDGRVFSDEGMVNYFASRFDMPRDPASPEYAEWFSSRGFRSYGIFLATHPGYVITELMERSDYLSEGFIQPYFTTAEIPSRQKLLNIGQIVHPETNAVILIDVILLAAMYGHVLRHPNARQWAWIWFATWVFGYACMSATLSFFGDNIGIHRHIFPAVETLRLLLWICLLVNMDLLVQKPETITTVIDESQILTQVKE